MNKREIILDFTSLLDVIMIILFFFILFSHFETEKVKADADSEQKAAKTTYAEAEELKEAAESVYAEAEKLMEEAKKKDELASAILSEAELAGERKNNNAEAIIEFGTGKNVRIFLKEKSGEWFLEIKHGDEAEMLEMTNAEKSPAEIGRSDIRNMAEKLSDLLSDMGYAPDDTILCEFFYEGLKTDTKDLYAAVNGIFDLLKEEYGHFLFSETDINY